MARGSGRGSAAIRGDCGAGAGAAGRAAGRAAVPCRAAGCDRLLPPRRPRRRIPLVPENLLKKRKAYQAIKATQAKQALLNKRKVGAAPGPCTPRAARLALRLVLRGGHRGSAQPCKRSERPAASAGLPREAAARRGAVWVLWWSCGPPVRARLGSSPQLMSVFMSLSPAEGAKPFGLLHQSTDLLKALSCLSYISDYEGVSVYHT